MANEMHLLLTAQGDYASSAPALANETWQVGLRFWLGIGGSVPDSVGPLSTDLSVEAKSINRTETNWTITSNWWIAGPGGLEHFSPDDYLNDQAGPAFETWIATSFCFATAVRLRQLRLYPIGSNGKAVPAPPYASGSPCTLTYTTIPNGGVSGEALPPQNTVVASHRTQQVGRRGRGRMFMPVGVTGQVEDGVLISSTVSALLANQVALLEALAVTGTSSVRPSIIGAPWTDYAFIDTVIVDNAMDTQRRRRRSIISTPSSASVSY